jgi:[ribosomal protein S18]-alanine N-acetyltransferase
VIRDLRPAKNFAGPGLDCSGPVAASHVQPMPASIRPYEQRDFSALYKLDQICFPPGIAYSKWTLRHFLDLPMADCLVATSDARIAGFILAEENPPLAHIITLDVAESHRRHGLGSALLAEIEQHFAYRGVRSVLLETAVNNEAGIAFWQRHGYRTEAVLQRYYLGRLDAYEMRKLLAGNSKPAPSQKEM